MKPIAILSIFFSVTLCHGQMIQEISILTDRIVLVHYTEGEIYYHGNGEAISSDIVDAEELDLSKIASASNYGLQSDDDSNYSNIVQASTLNRKTKGVAFANYCEGWDYLPFYDLQGCQNASKDHVAEHLIYVEFPFPMTTGNSYRFTIAGIFDGEPPSIEIDYEEGKIFTNAIHINNLGYSTNSPAKYGYVYHWLGDGGGLSLEEYDQNNFWLLDVDNDQKVFEGQLEFRKDRFNIETGQNNPTETSNQNFLGADVYECEFSAFNTPGRYRLVIDGIGSSDDFEISCDVYKPAFQAVMSGIFQNRSGIEITSAYSNQPRPADHNPLETPGFANRLFYTSTTICEVSDADADVDDIELWEAGIKGNLDAWGWYQDAGDWDGYLRHMHVPSKLLFAFDAFSENFEDGQLDLVENENGLPDILDEARWLLRFYKRLKDETEDKGWTTGGIPGARVFGDLWGVDLPGDIGRGSWQDNDRDWYVSGEDPVASYWYAALAAHFSIILNKYGLIDPEGIDWKAEAVATYAWAEENYDAEYTCYDQDIDDLRNYASSALYVLTGEFAYNDDFRDSWNKIRNEDKPFDNERSYGGFLYNQSIAPDTDLSVQIQNLIVSKLEEYTLGTAESRACRWGGNFYFPMLVGHGTGPKIFEAIMGYVWVLENNPESADSYLGYLYTTADYFLGTNPLGMTWISGFDHNSPKEIFHLDDRYSDEPNIRRGIVPYGPWRNEEVFFNMGPFNHNWPSKTLYPSIEEWPGHERYFGGRYAPFTGEFTIEETNLNAAILYGVLSGKANCSDETSEINEITSASDFTVSPNPSSNEIFFKVDNFENLPNLKVFDMNGVVVLNERAQQGRTKLNIRNLVNGVYILQLEGNGKKLQSKFIKIGE